eukprot:g25241.t1
MTSEIDSASLLSRASELIDLARAAGADKADAVVVRSRSRSVSVRLGKVEGTESSESDDFSLRVFIGNRVASVSANPGFDMRTLAERAVSMARVSPEDPFACLADEADLASTYPDLDLFDPTEVSTDQLREAALKMESAALAVEGVSNSSGAGASAGMGGLVLVTSHGFSGSYMASRFGRSVSVIAGEGTKMERDYDFDSRLYAADLDDAETIGRRAGERVVRRINPRQVETASNITVVLDPRLARGFVGHIASAINGAAVARKTSFLRDRMGQQVLKAGLSITDDPLVVRGASSRPFDGEGVSGERLTMIEDGVLKHWFLSTSTGRELGLPTNGRGVRGGNSVSPASTNLALEPGELSPEDLIASVGTGLYVTELIGQGVNMVTGEYSRGASGFWIENGKLSYPVSEVTIASNLKDMFMRITPANDIDRKFGVASPTLAIEGMTMAGREATWCVSVAVVHLGRPVAGVLVAPALKEEFAAAEALPALKNGQAITVSTQAADRTLVLAADEKIVRRLQPDLAVQRVQHVPSLAYRLAMAAEGRIDGTIVKRNSHDWDLAAADLILERAGGALTDLDGSPLLYNRETVSHGVLVAGASHARQLLVPHLLTGLAG